MPHPLISHLLQLKFLHCSNKCNCVHLFILFTVAMVSLGNMVYAIGGSNGSEYLDSVEYYDPCKLKWVESVKLPCPRFAPAAVTLSRKELKK